MSVIAGWKSEGRWLGGPPWGPSLGSLLMEGGLHREGLVDQLLLVLIVLDGDSGRGGGGHGHVSAPRSLP